MASIDDPREVERDRTREISSALRNLCALDGRRSLHGQRAGARERRGAPDRRRTAASVLLAFEASPSRGWRRLKVSARDRDLVVRARIGLRRRRENTLRGCRGGCFDCHFGWFWIGDGGQNEEVGLGDTGSRTRARRRARGCATKKLVKEQVGEVNDKVETLSKSVEENQERTRANEGRIGEVDQKAQAADQKAQTRRTSAPRRPARPPTR